MSDKAAMRAAVLRGECPFCHATGFRIVAMHVWRKHGLSTRELREEIGFNFIEPICAKDVSAALAARMKDRPPTPGRPPPPTHPMSAAGSTRIAELARKKIATLTPEALSAAGKKGGSVKSPKKGTHGVGSHPWNAGRKSPVVHGTHTEYRKGCRCDACKGAMLSHRNEWYRRRVLKASGKNVRIYRRKACMTAELDAKSREATSPSL